MLFDKTQLSAARTLAFGDRAKYDAIVEQIEKLMPGSTVTRLKSQRVLVRPTLDKPLSPVETYETNKNTYVVRDGSGVEVFRAPSQKGLLRLVLKQAEKWIKETDFITLDEEREAIAPLAS